MWYRIPLVLIVAFCCSGAAFGQTKPPAQGNLVVNGGFEQGGAGWRFVSTGAVAGGQVDGAEAHEGKYSYKLTNKSGYAPNLFARIVQEVSGLRPFTTYKVSLLGQGQRLRHRLDRRGAGLGDSQGVPPGRF